MKNIIVYGLGYVGLSNALLLAQKNNVIGIEIDTKKIDKLNKGISPIQDSMIQEYLDKNKLNLTIKTRVDDFSNIDYIIVSTPTNYDENINYFDTSSIDNILEYLNSKKVKSVIVIKSTIPIGYTNLMKNKYKKLNLIFSPEFLREGFALHDNLYPSRIVVGTDLKNKELTKKAEKYANIMKDCALKKDIKTFIVDFKEAESCKLFANTYLAMRVAFFNELDGFAITNNLNAKNIISCVCADDRIGDFYNNPSFGYGGYCLPKDTKQLNSEFIKTGTTNSLIGSISKSNCDRKQNIAKEVICKTSSKDIIGIYKLAMKSNSDNCRSSAIIDIIKILSKDRKIIIYDKTHTDLCIENCSYESSLKNFKKASTLILTNRIDKQLKDVKQKIYSRDIFGNN